MCLFSARLSAFVWLCQPKEPILSVMETPSITAQSCQCPSLAVIADRDIWQHRVAQASDRLMTGAQAFTLPTPRAACTRPLQTRDKSRQWHTILYIPQTIAYPNIKIAAVPRLRPSYRLQIFSLEPCISTSKSLSAELGAQLSLGVSCL